MQSMSGYGPGAFGRNSHVPACLECRTRKAKCSKTQPCGSCTRHNRKCVYASKVHRTPLTREHLTAVENRLHLLEAALGGLFPDGEMQEISRELLLEESPGDRMSSNADNEWISADNTLSYDPLVFDDLPNPTQFMAPEFDSSPVDADNWSAPQADTIAAPEEEAKFVDIYFAHYNTVYPMLHEETFRLVQGGQSAPPHWPVLANMVLALGAWLSVDVREELDLTYFARAEQHFQKISMGNRGNLILVQGLVLLSEFAQKQGSPEKSGRYVGSAVHISIGLNLHVETQDSKTSELDREIRRRVWWSVYCAESCSAKIYGRPLLLPEDTLITVRPVSNIHENTLTSSSTTFPPQSDESTIYTGLIQQSSYHRMANKIYRHLLSSPNVTAQDVQEADEMIDTWHKGSSLCLQVTNPSSAPEWYFIARRRQVLCDRSLRLLVHRPLLLRWLRRKSIDGETSTADHSSELHCRAQGLAIARTTIDMISDLIATGRSSRLTLSFTLYALFHALIVPLVYIKANPSSPESISCVQDIEKAGSALQYLPEHMDALSNYFMVALRRLACVSSQAAKQHEGTTEGKRAVKPHDVRSSVSDIFGNQELELLKSGDLRSSPRLDFSEWVHS
ncbi:hypothetical protein P170DRAFT_376303 [Aspergillus steynii IBT 23096]|uniref:Zn(2)-C6 fungal-type domain-containing protein n=1 Tax=Aspergillus steynii IBT 23096 TaxID=1392250 RepID=A0A2I2GKN7_9EURO|nr:uncharacterized protein P170DRAFT_376303 [Aspergillus steynii IBT 23096]PLB53444.1 hypothetical protein P170DRAFT_376303 [Aspergillus steynii IBT 23096]